MFSKLNIIILLLLFANTSPIIAQRIQPLPLPQFTEADPIWSFRPEWEDQIGRPLDSLEYSVIGIPFILQVDKEVVVGTNNFNSDTSYSGFLNDGIGVYSFDLLTGEPNLSDIYTRSTGADDFITIIKENVSSKSGKLTLVGSRSNQGVIGGKYDYAYRRVYDMESGTVLSHDYDETDSTILDMKWGFGGLYIPRPKEDGYLNFYCTPVGFQDTKQFRMIFQWINETMDSTSGIVKALFHDTELPVYSFMYVNGYKYMTLNDTTILVLLPTRHQDSVYKSTVELIWIDISDIDNIHIKKTKRIEEYAIYNDWNYEACIFKEQNGDIYISDFYLDTATWRRHTYLLHLDSEGEMVSYVKDLEVDGNIYGRINNILYIDEGNDKVYLEMLGSKTDLAGSDIISVTSTGDITFETSITTGHEWEEDFRAVYTGEGGMITDEGIMILPRKVRQLVEIKPGQEWTNTTAYIVAWDVRDFGMEWNPSATADIEKVVVDIDIKVFPNPTVGEIEVEVINLENDIVNVDLYDIEGRKLESQKLEKGDLKANFDLKAYASGSYFVHLSNENGVLLKKLKVIKL